MAQKLMVFSEATDTDFVKFSSLVWHFLTSRYGQLILELAAQTRPYHLMPFAGMQVCVYIFQEHMAITCCQGSLSPGLASPATGQMAAHWAPKSNCAAQDTLPALCSYLGSSCLPGGIFSYNTSLDAKTLLYAGGPN